jgi:hypothetical protein
MERFVVPGACPSAPGRSGGGSRHSVGAGPGPAQRCRNLQHKRSTVLKFRVHRAFSVWLYPSPTTSLPQLSGRSGPRRPNCFCSRVTWPRRLHCCFPSNWWKRCCAMLCGAVLCRAVPCRAVLCCAVLCCAVLCCAVLCCGALLCCAVLRCAVLCCVVPSVLLRSVGPMRE